MNSNSVQSVFKNSFTSALRANVINEQLPDAAADVVAGLRAGVAAGAEPMTVADAIVDAVRDDRFWVLPQPEVAYGALDRVQRIVDGRPPVDLAG